MAHRRHTKHVLWQKRALPARVAAPDPAAGNPLNGYVAAYLEWWRTTGHREQGVVLKAKALRRFIS